MSPLRKPRAARTDAILDNLATAVVCLDEQLRVIYLNPASEILFAVSARHCGSEPVDKTLPHFMHHTERLQQALAQGAAYTEREVRLHASNGEQITADCTATPFNDSNGEPRLLLEFFSLDRHLRISREDHMRHQNLANREMLRGLAHEIKNPLGGLRGAAQLLEREIDNSDLREYTSVIIREADRLQNLVDSMLGPRMPPNKVEMNVHEALEHVRQLVTPQLPENSKFIRDYDPSIPRLFADREQLIQIVLNLVGNAVHALKAGGRITLRTRTQRLFTIGQVQHRLVVRIDIIDDGDGIPDEMLPNIFHPMVTSRADGSGMGLPIAQYLVDLHGGLIECESQPGLTEFSVYLPMRKAPGENHE